MYKISIYSFDGKAEFPAAIQYLVSNDPSEIILILIWWSGKISYYYKFGNSCIA